MSGLISMCDRMQKKEKKRFWLVVVSKIDKKEKSKWGGVMMGR